MQGWSRTGPDLPSYDGSNQVDLHVKPARFTSKTRILQPRRAATHDGATNTHACQYYKLQSNQFLKMVSKTIILIIK